MGSLATHNNSSHRSHSRLIAICQPDHKKSRVGQDKFKPTQQLPTSLPPYVRVRALSILSEGVKLFKIGAEINCRDNLASPRFAAERVTDNNTVTRVVRIELSEIRARYVQIGQKVEG